MITDTEGIVLKQVKALGGRRMICIFSRRFGKISVGTGLNEGGKKKAALAIRPFTYGRYELFKNRDSYNLSSGQVLKSFYAIGEDIDKYMAASYVLELTERMLPEEVPQPRLFSLLRDFMAALEKREKKHKTLVMAYMIKALDILGSMPEMNRCACCGAEIKTEPGAHIFFSVAEGGTVCFQCAGKAPASKERPLIYREDVGIIDIFKYFQKSPIEAFEKIGLDDDAQEALQRILKEYIAYHLDIKGLKSESFF